jgi:hypothetical protein
LAFWATAFDDGRVAVIDKHGTASGDPAYGFAFRVAAGIPTAADCARLEAGEQPEPGAAPPPGLDLVS